MKQNLITLSRDKIGVTVFAQKAQHHSELEIEDQLSLSGLTD